MRITDTQVLFWRTADIYSNWHPSRFVVEGVEYNSVEQWMMAGKAKLFNDLEALAKIMATPVTNPSRIKALGRQVKGYDEQVWAANRERIVDEGVLAKFTQNDAMKRELLATGDRVIVEASPVDFIWGVGLAEDDPRVEDPSKWKGLNLLGISLMRARTALSA